MKMGKTLIITALVVFSPSSNYAMDKGIVKETLTMEEMRIRTGLFSYKNGVRVCSRKKGKGFCSQHLLEDCKDAMRKALNDHEQARRKALGDQEPLEVARD